MNRTNDGPEHDNSAGPREMPNLPPLLEEADQGIATCVRRIGTADCGALAKYHIIWTEDAENGRACEEHAMEAIRKWSPVQVHALTHACITPGAKWFPEEKTCKLPDDGNAGEENEQVQREIIGTSR